MDEMNSESWAARVARPGEPQTGDWVRTLLEHEVANLLRETPPVRMLSEARLRALDAKELPSVIEARGKVPEVLCEGHFPGLSMAPMSALGLVLGQAGSLLAAVRAGSRDTEDAFMATAADGLRLRSRDPVRPGRTVIATATILRERRGFYVFEGSLRIMSSGALVLTVDKYVVRRVSLRGT